ncbi:hypothetical protein RRF57_012912 [Xylaria bambusicola]|uniref:Uncharacterized protein n=1 Tax=Xylaria bambusicola TaxID=326684 RepID=A0AAN7UQL7_9PEZI
MRALGITGKKPLKQTANQLVAKDINKSLTHRKIGHGIRQFTTPKARTVEGVNLNESSSRLPTRGVSGRTLAQPSFSASARLRSRATRRHAATRTPPPAIYA